MAIAVVQTLTKKITSGGSGSSTSAAWGSQPTVGNKMICNGAAYADNATPVATVTDNQSGNTHTVDVTPGCGGVGERNLAWISACQIAGSSGSFTCTVALSAGTDKYFAWGGIEVSGLATSSALDKTVSTSDFDITTNDATGTTATLTQADEIVISAIAIVGSFTADANIHVVIPGSWSSIWTESNNVSNNCGGGAYLIVSATTAVTAAWAHDNPVAGAKEAAIAIATYKMAGADGGATAHDLTLLGCGA